MLVKALEEYLSNSTSYSLQNCTLYVSTYERKKTFLFKEKIGVRIIADLKGTIVPFEQMIDIITNHLKVHGIQCIVDCIWFICSSQGGIYLYETIAEKEHLKTGILRNKFIIMNTENGTTSFGPGHKNNKIVSQRLFQLLGNSRLFTREKWLEQMFDVFKLCEVIRTKGLKV